MKQTTDFKVQDRKDFGDAVMLRLRSKNQLLTIQPGQFANVQVDGSSKTYLRRPISIHDVDDANNELCLLIQKVGEGTKRLAELKYGDKVNLVYPLGTGYTMPAPNDRVLLVGGGIGIAPLYYFAKMLNKKGVHPTMLLGGKSKDTLLRLADYEKQGEVFVTTEDGTLGEKGFVTAHSMWKDHEFDKIYVCGPKPMMQAVAAIAKEKKIWCEVSLENRMACGIGACLCCVEDTVDGNVCVCKEGPVFNIDRLKW